MSELTVKEVALISDVPARSVEKAIETGVLVPVKRRAVFSETRARYIGIDAISYFAAVGHMTFLKGIPVSRKKALMKAIRELPGPGLQGVDLEPGLYLDLPMIAGRKLETARAYVEGKMRYVTTNPDIFGGVPIIKGTRIPVHAIRSRLEDGETLDDLAEDFPRVPRDALIVADIYARSHPQRGRPVKGGRPWEATANRE